jgi:hypothetical protein
MIELLTQRATLDGQQCWTVNTVNVRNTMDLNNTSLTLRHGNNTTQQCWSARQYLGCPATSATVERLFSQVGIAFSKKRKRAEAGTIEDLMFSRINLP